MPSTNSEQIIVCNSSESSEKNGDSDNDCVYMKPGSYNVPKRNESSTNNSPRSFEFLETAQNVHRRMRDKPAENNVEKIWQNAQTAAPSLISKMSPTESVKELGILQDLLPGGSDVQTWIDTGLYPVMNELETNPIVQPNNPKQIVVLQRTKSTLLDVCNVNDGFLRAAASKTVAGVNKPSENESSSTLSKNSNSKVEITSRTYRKRAENNEAAAKIARRVFPGDENKRCGNLTVSSVTKFKEIVNEMKATEFSAHLNHENSKVGFLRSVGLERCLV